MRTLSRWRSDKFRYPPYQYKPEYIIYTKAGKWRLIDSSERELLHGYGWEHTSLCWSASKIKQDLEGYESTRCSEIGDSFSIYSFCIFAWMSFFDLLPRVDYQHLCNRMGLALQVTARISQCLALCSENWLMVLRLLFIILLPPSLGFC